MKRSLGVVLGLAVCAGALAQEFWHFARPNAFYGVYRRYQKSKFDWEERPVGYIETKVSDAELGGVACKRYVSIWTTHVPPKDAVQPPILKAAPGTNLLEGDPARGPGSLFVPAVRTVETWVDPQGRVLRVFSRFTAFRTETILEANFKEDGVELLVKDNAGTRNVTLMPQGGVKAFENPILRLIAEAEKDRTESEFSCFDPKSGGIHRYTAKVISRFSSTSLNRKVEGYTLEVRAPEGKFLLHVAKDGMVYQMDLPNGDKAYARDFPTEYLTRPPERF